MAAQYRSVVPLAIAHDSEGRDVYLYQGVPVPENVPADEVKRLVEGGFVADDSAKK